MGLSLENLQAMKRAKTPIASITAYDATQSRTASSNGIDVILVGDSLGVIVSGYETTVPVTMDQMIYHTTCVHRGNQGSFLMSDLPFMSYFNAKTALKNAAALMRAGAQMVKLEGGSDFAETVYALTKNGVPVCGHLGLTPQSVYIQGYKVFGSQDEGSSLLKDAKVLAQAGAQLLVLKCVHHSIAKKNHPSAFYTSDRNWCGCRLRWPDYYIARHSWIFTKSFDIAR